METKESIDFMAKTSISKSDFEKSASSRDTAGNSSFKRRDKNDAVKILNVLPV